MLALVNLALGTPTNAAPPAKRSLQEVSDLDILNSGLLLEQIGGGLGTVALAGDALGDQARALFESVSRNGIARTAALTRAIREADPSYSLSEALDSYTFGDTSTETALYAAAMRLGTLAAGAYSGSAALFTDTRNLALAASSLQGICRELATVRFLSGQSPAPDAFSGTLTAAQVTRQLAPILGR